MHADNIDLILLVIRRKIDEIAREQDRYTKMLDALNEGGYAALVKMLG